MNTDSQAIDGDAGAARRRPHRTPFAWFPYALPVITAAILWYAFFPGIISYDSVSQYAQAVSGQFSDWHPPIMAVTLHSVMRLGGDIGLVTLLQSIVILGGVFALAQQCLRASVRPVATRWLAGATLLLLLIPLSPLGVYAVVFWKDAWVVGMLVWVLTIGWRLLTLDGKPKPRHWALLTCFTVICGILTQTRHNAIVLIPLFCLTTLAIALHLRRKELLVLALLPALVHWGVGRFLANRYPIQLTHPERQVMTLEQIGYLALHPDRAQRVPYVASIINPDFDLKQFQFGDFFQMNPESGGAIRARTKLDPDRIEREYWQLVRTDPFALAWVKVRAFAPLFGLKPLKSFAYAEVEYNTFSLRHKPERQWLRAVTGEVSVIVGTHPVLRWVFGVPLPWLLANTVIAVVWLRRWRRDRTARRAGELLLILTPLGYMLSYLIANASLEYRFVYPAILPMQVVAVAMLCRSVWRRLAEPQISR